MIKFAFFILFLALLLATPVRSSSFYWDAGPDSLLSHARRLFYKSIENEETLNPALAAFRRLEEYGGKWKAKALTYHGALVALKGKHAFWPHKKMEYVNRGLPLMDRGLAMRPDDIESLFVHASTCWYLPFFFGRGDEAERHFRQIIDLLPSQSQNYDPVLIENAVAFIRENIDMTAEERVAIESVANAEQAQ